MGSFRGRRFGEGAGGRAVEYRVIQCVSCFGGRRFGEDVESEFDAPETGAGSLVTEADDPVRRVRPVLTGYELVTKKRNQSFYWLRFAPDALVMLFDNQEDGICILARTRCRARRLIRT
jgi:hypothetical protein